MDEILYQTLQFIGENFWYVVLVILMTKYRRPWGILLVILNVMGGGYDPVVVAVISVAALLFGQDTSITKAKLKIAEEASKALRPAYEYENSSCKKENTVIEADEIITDADK